MQVSAKNDPSDFVLFEITSVFNGLNIFNFTINALAYSSAQNPFSNYEDITLSFSIAGNDGSSGSSGTSGSSGSSGTSGSSGSSGTSGVDGALTVNGATNNGVLTYISSNGEVQVEECFLFDTTFRILNSGDDNTPQGMNSSILGGADNIVNLCANNAVIAGGKNNEIQSYNQSSFIGAGVSNVIEKLGIGGGNFPALYNSIVAGTENRISNGAVRSFIGAGQCNIISGSGSFIGAGFNNYIDGEYSSILGGSNNRITGDYSLAGGEFSLATANQSFAYGYNVTASAGASTSFGAVNVASGLNSFAAGGVNNKVCACNGLVSGFDNEMCSGAKSAIVSGEQNVVTSPFGLVVGNSNNVLGGSATSVRGGNIVGGCDNTVGGQYTQGNLVMGNTNIVGNSTTHVSSGGVFGGGNELYANGTVIIGENNCTITGQNQYGHQSLIVGCENQNHFGEASIVGGFASGGYGRSSIAFGLGATTANGCQQYAFGQGTTNPNNGSTANVDNQFIIGKYNIWNITDCHLFAIGNGDADVSRSNAFNVSLNGRVGVGKYNPAYTFDVTGTGRFTGDVRANDFITTSDKRLKSNIKEISNGLDIIKQFTAYEYEKAGKQDAGFIAQEVAESIPYAVSTDSDGNLNMSDRPVLAHMHKAILELEKRIEAIENKLT